MAARCGTGWHRWPVDLVLLDVMLPAVSGLDLCLGLRECSDVAIIMLTARGAETDRVLGLEFGADDYIAKSFSRPKLLARIRALLRRGAVSRRATDPGRRYLEFDGWASRHCPVGTGNCCSASTDKSFGCGSAWQELFADSFCARRADWVIIRRDPFFSRLRPIHMPERPVPNRYKRLRGISPTDRAETSPDFALRNDPTT
jgi:hypothetical protein